MRLLFLATFIASLALQGLWWGTQGIYDADIWGRQPLLIRAGDPEQFNGAAAYGHPGGPIIYAAAAVHSAAVVEPTTALLVGLTVLMSLGIALIAVLLYLLTHTRWVPVAMTVFFAAHPLYTVATPPSALAAVLAAALVLLTLYALRRTTFDVLLSWGAIAGILVATRADVGAAFTLALGIALITQVGVVRMLAPLAAGIGTFIVLDPFMWLLPVTHLQDLAFKAYFHFAIIPPSVVALPILLLACVGTLVSIVLCGATARRAPEAIPVKVYLALLTLTALMTAVLLSAQYQAYRYFMPLIFAWEALLPLAVVVLGAHLPHRKLYIGLFAVALLAYPIAHLVARLV